MKRKQNTKKKQKHGTGVFSDIVDAVTYLPKKAYQTIGNIIDKDANLQFGEIHQPQITSEGIKFSFSGPGTQKSRFLNKEQAFSNNTSNNGRQHDALYFLGQNEQDINKADERFIKNAFSSIAKNPFDIFNTINSGISGSLIGLKYLGDKIGITDNKEMLEQNKKLTAEEIKAIREASDEQTKKGYGKLRKHHLTKKKK